MRTVYRASVAPPPTLLNQTVVDAAKSNYSTNRRITNSLYDAADVVTALKRLYLSKCFLCERDASVDGLVEHFLPHHPDHSARAYLWTNLHWSCQKCNGRKTQKRFKEFFRGTNAVSAMLLLDPCDPPVSIDQIISFDNELRAVALPLHAGDAKTLNTTAFLNEPLPRSERDSCYRSLADLVFEANCKPEWETLVTANTLNLTDFAPELQARYLRAMDYADRLYISFLTEECPFSTSMRCIVENRLRIPVSRLKEFGRKFREVQGLAARY